MLSRRLENKKMERINKTTIKENMDLGVFICTDEKPEYIDMENRQKKLEVKKDGDTNKTDV